MIWPAVLAIFPPSVVASLPLSLSCSLSLVSDPRPTADLERQGDVWVSIYRGQTAGFSWFLESPIPLALLETSYPAACLETLGLAVVPFHSRRYGWPIRPPRLYFQRLGFRLRFYFDVSKMQMYELLFQSLWYNWYEKSHLEYSTEQFL